MSDVEMPEKRVFLVNENESLSVCAPSGKEYDLVWDSEGNELVVIEEGVEKNE